MSEIRNLTRNGETFYPLTCTEGLVNRDGNVVGEINDIFDISEYNATGTPPVLATYSSLSLALAVVPQSKQKGGMTIRYVQSSDNKYVQYRLMHTLDNASTAAADFSNTANWQGVDDEPTAGSNNLVKSGGVALEAVYDVSAKNPTAGLNNDGKFESLSALLSDANLNTLIPISVRKGGMSVKFLQNVYATYSVEKFEDLYEAPTGTQIESYPNIESGIYLASELSMFASLPTTISTPITYYIAVTVDEETTYTEWVITKLTDDSVAYSQCRLLTENWSVNPDDWENISEELQNAIVIDKNDLIDFPSDRIQIRKQRYFNGTSIVINENLYTVAINVAGLSEIKVNCYNVRFGLYSTNSLPEDTGDVNVIESHSGAYQVFENNCNWLLLSNVIGYTATLILKSRVLIVNDNGQILSKTPTSRLNGDMVKYETMLEGDILPKLRPLVESKNMLDPSKIFGGFISTSTGEVFPISTNKMAVIENVVLSDWHCFSANENLNLNRYNGVSVYFDGKMVCAKPTQNYSPQINGPEIELILQPNTNGFKIRIPEFTLPVTLYIGVGNKDNVNLQFEKGDTPTEYTPYGQSIVGTDYSAQISQLSREVKSLAAQIEDVKSVPSRWAGCRYAAFGDSITDEHYAPYRKYTSLIADALSCETYENYGTSGMTMTKSDEVTNNFIRRVSEYNYLSFDLVTIMFGTNDCVHQLPIGTLGSLDEYTFIGAYSKAIKTMLQANPSLRIVLLTIFQTVRVRNQDGSAGAGLDYVNAIKAIGQYFGCPVIDVWSNSGITIENASTYTDGGLHPNAAGQEYSGGYIVSQIKNL